MQDATTVSAFLGLYNKETAGPTQVRNIMIMSQNGVSFNSCELKQKRKKIPYYEIEYNQG